MSNAQFAALDTLGVDAFVRHDLAGMLMPGQRYFARLTNSHGKFFGRTLSFGTQADDTEPMSLRIALLSCQANAKLANRAQPSWAAVQRFGPDLILHMGDFGYWGGSLHPNDPYTAHIAKYASQLTSLTTMRSVMESASSLIQVSDHETSGNNGENWNDPVTATALEAYFRIMPYRSFDDPTQRSRLLIRNLGTNILLLAPDFRSLDRSLSSLPDDAEKTAYGETQFALLTEALQRPEALKIILSDPSANPTDPPSIPNYWPDKWCTYQSAYQAMVDVIATSTTTDGKPIQAEIWSGDRHYLSALSAEDNRWAPGLFDVLTSSGVDMHSLPLQPGEAFDQIFGNSSGDLSTDHPVNLHMEIELSDDKAGTITRIARGIDDQTGIEVVHAEKSWSY